MRKTKLRTLCILLVILLVVCVGIFVLSRYEEKQEEIKNSDEVILEIPTDSVTALSWEYDETSLSFHRDTDWYWDDDAAFPVDADVISNLLSQFESFGVSFVIEDVEDYSQYGLDDPTAVIRIQTEDSTYEIQLGAYSTMDEERYVSIGDGCVYLVSHDPMDDYELTIEDLIRNDTVPTLSDATALAFSGNEDYEIRYLEDSDLSWCADDVYFTGDDPLDSTSVRSYLSSLQNLSLDTYASYNVTDEELSAYGLADPDLSVTVTYPVTEEDSDETHDETFTLEVGRNQEELSAAIEAAAESEDQVADFSDVTAYVRVGDSQIIYQISNDTYETLTAVSYDELRHSELVTASFDDVTQIDITLEDTTYTMTAVTNDEEETEWNFEDREEIRFTLYLDNETWPQIEVVLYRYDGSSCLAEVNGSPVAFISRDLVVDLVEAVNAVVLD